ncbi:MAG: hypothetical protein AMJ91_06365 [candidate division Zixibacteria bacterium SM23_73_3]|nr:MAG: hypothetical protein AMJ91_06365 [candidate division Zixibacteria bacterium SM23_73_3]
MNSGEDLRQTYRILYFCVCSCPFVGILRGGNSASISQITPSVNKSLVISSEIFPFEKTVLMARTRKHFGKGGVRANKTNSVPRKN